MVLAYGRDPYFPGWPDTLQLNYGNPAMQEAMIGELVRIAGQCDGVRCDMAMLVLPDVFERTWGIRRRSLLAEGDRAVRRDASGFLFMAEVYWDLEWTLQQQGFDYTYDKRLYDRLREGACPAGARAFPRRAGLPGQAGPLPGKPRRAAGRGDVFRQKSIRPRRSSRSCRRGCDSSTRGSSRAARNASLPILVAGPRKPVERRPANSSTTGCSPCCVGLWCVTEVATAGMCTRLGRQLDLRLLPGLRLAGAGDERLMVAVNYAPNQSQCYVRLPFTDLGSAQLRFEDVIRDASYERDGDDLGARELYLDEPPWGARVFCVTKIGSKEM